MLEIIPIPAFRDNYIWLLNSNGYAAVVDPGDAGPVMNYLHARQLQLDAILITHHHDDHIGGVAELLATFPTEVFAPRGEGYAFPHQAVAEGDAIELETLGLRLQVLETPGHTLGHVVYYGADCLFCGDTLFGCGCGRLFEGTCQQMFDSLQRLTALPPETLVYCAHEYTQHNIRFARSLDPDSQSLKQREALTEQQIHQGRPSLPSTMQLELATNPFLRCQQPPTRVVEMMRQSGIAQPDPLSTFCFIRKLRNSF